MTLCQFLLRNVSTLKSHSIINGNGRIRSLQSLSSTIYNSHYHRPITALSFHSCGTPTRIKITTTTTTTTTTTPNQQFHVVKTFANHQQQHKYHRFLSNISSENGKNDDTIDNNDDDDNEENMSLLEQTRLLQEQENLTVSILGPSNAGKSTLFNRLMCKESNRSYRLSSEKSLRRPKRSKGRLGNNHPSRQNGGAIVSATPGTTRDRRECIGRIGGTYFTLVDTAGVDGERISLLSSKKKNNSNHHPNNNNNNDDYEQSLETKMIQQTLEAARQSDVILLMFDAKVGLTADFDDIVRWLRKIRKKESTKKDTHYHHSGMKKWEREVIILANKLEGDAWSNYYMNDNDAFVLDNISEVSRLGFGEPIPISAEHGEGMADIATVIEELSKKKRRMLGIDTNSQNQEEEEDDDHHPTSNMQQDGDDTVVSKEKPLRLAILGRINVGKSTLVNSLLKQDRVIAGSMPGLTRDSIAINWSWMGRPVQLVDTAGIRRMAKRDHSNDIEDLAVRDAMRAMKIADVAVLVLDAEARMLQRQELAIADAVVREGRSLVVVANKMDLLIEKDYTKDQYAAAVREQIEIRFPMLRSTPVIPMSSLTGEAVDDLMPIVFNARDRWARVINTGLLNRWLVDVIEGQSPPIVQGRPAKIKYIMQVKGRPPTFMLFCNVDKLPVSYLRYLTRNFQHTFEMFGMEVRLAVKRSAPDNPFHDKDKKSGGSGIGGVEFRKKRFIANLKATGKPMKKGRKRRTQKARYR